MRRIGTRIAVVLFAIVAFGRLGAAAEQTGSSAQDAPPLKTAVGAVSKPGEFYSKEIDVHFNYPVEMSALDPSAEMERGHMNIYGSSGDNDPEHKEAKRCVLPYLVADLPEDKAPKRMGDLGTLWVDDTKEYKDTRKPEPIMAKIMMVEIVRDCLPKKLRKNENDALGNIALSFVSEPGIMRQPNPLWFEIAGEKVHMNSGAGRPIVNGQLSPAPILTMAMSAQWRGHLLAWVFVSNDTETFNEITKSLVQFGGGPWGTMFPANYGPKGSGTPMTILPN